MTGAEFHGYTRAIGAPENWKENREENCVPLFIRDGELAGHHSMESVWVLSDSEREEIARGANISLMILGAVHPPVTLTVTRVKILDNDPHWER
jgi:hypothetical protein